ncbi:hypothetical protein I3842_13G174200 [Carya illinoinensis]|uniref:DUF7755 domain-containing protein n=1 Tax=Carya illinoinensis TaxID=32201 RepID=A0A922DEU4_CARIL|nr:hypothetical protein I3842_13G174200 [Carya illinoinensis]
MESLSLSQIISAGHQGSERIRNPASPIHRRRTHAQTRRFRFSIVSKRFDFQDFQGYAKPARLLPAKEVKVCTDTSTEKIFPSFKEDGSQCLFKIKLGTSNFYGSSLSDLNAGILLCLIGENGDSILQRIPASLMTAHSRKLEDVIDRDMLHFQRGSVDEFIFKGPNLGRVEALWISLESGQWRLGSVSLTVICGFQPSLEEQKGDELDYSGFQYDFQTEDFLLGEGSDVSMVELRPSLATQFSGVDSFALFGKSLSQETLLESRGISNEESMREYADLKISLLLYDTILIFVGTSAAFFLAGENTSFAFLTGGVGGFLYLLLLQRSVDGLPTPKAPTNISTKTEGTNGKFGGFKGPISSLALVIGFSIFLVKNSYGDLPLAFTPKELIAGMMGFLSCKVAVVLAALKPLPMGLKINK